jgi:hypothetical protein
MWDRKRSTCQSESYPSDRVLLSPLSTASRLLIRRISLETEHSISGARTHATAIDPGFADLQSRRNLPVSA